MLMKMNYGFSRAALRVFVYAVRFGIVVDYDAAVRVNCEAPFVFKKKAE